MPARGETMRRPPINALLLAAAGILAAAGPVPAVGEAGFDDGVIHQIHYPDWFKDSFLDLQDDAATAAEDGKQGLFLFFTTQGCSYCYLFIEKSLGDPAIAERLQAHFDTIGLEIFSDAELTDFAGEATRVKTFAVDQGVEFAPTLLFYDTAGERLLRLTGYYGPERFSQVLDYLIEGRYQDTTLRAYLAAAGSPAAAGDDGGLIDDPLFAAPPYALDRSRMAAERPLLVLFEGAGCPRCRRFHDEVLGDESIRARLAGFDVVRLDAADTDTPVLMPDGGRTTPRAWYDALGFTQLPALVFFNEDGRRVLASDALVLNSRMHNSIGFVTERAYDKGWNYQRYARSQALERLGGADTGGGQ
jgi:thioredoxin-related protein